MSDEPKGHSQMIYYGNAFELDFNKPKEPHMSISKEHLQYLINVGKALHKLEEVAKHELLDDLSKHNDFWRSDETIHYETVDEKLDAIRMQLSFISDKLWDVVSLLDIQGDDEETT